MEFLIRKNDKINPNNEELNKQCLKAGDVVVAVEDGHNWTQREKTNQDWRIVKIPGLGKEVVNKLLEQDDINGLRRKYKFSPGVLNQDVIDFWNDDSRSNPEITINYSPSMIKRKP